MKLQNLASSSLVFAASLGLNATALHAQSALPAAGATAPETNALHWRATARDGISTTWEATEPVTNAVTRAVTIIPHRYVAVASGLNFLDSTGQWSES